MASNKGLVALRIGAVVVGVLGFAVIAFNAVFPSVVLVMGLAVPQMVIGLGVMGLATYYWMRCNRLEAALKRGGL